MAWLIGLGIFAFLIFKFPAFRVFSLVAGGIIILLIIWLFYSSEQKQKTAESLIPIDQIQVTNLILSKGSLLYQLSGEVKNNSNHELTDITFAVNAYDCPGESITSDCNIIGQDDDVSTYIDIPPGQVRSLNNVTYVNLDNMPPVRGHFLWSYSILGTIGQ